MTLVNISTQGLIANKVVLADDPFSRMKGLLGRASFSDGEALIISGCHSIHMLFMRFAIDVVFVDRSWLVVGLVRGIRPFAFSPVFWKAFRAIELPSGSIARKGIEIGQKLFLEKSGR